jgi:peptidoglycan/xylan/chitin deacetylase (PgdA/CDA1 family)
LKLDSKLRATYVATLVAVMVLTTLTTGYLWKKTPQTEPVQIRSLVIIRIDDIQDYAFKEEQDFLLKFHADNSIPVDLAIIPGFLGEDEETITLIKNCIQKGAEISTHGWLHEDLSLLDEANQTKLLARSTYRLEHVLGVKSTILVPPMYDYNNATISAMEKNGYMLLSSSIDINPPGKNGNVLLIPATVELSNFTNSTWSMKTPAAVIQEIDESVSRYGYAVVVTHPQEFLRDEVLADDLVNNYKELITSLKERYQLTNFIGRADSLKNIS